MLELVPVDVAAVAELVGELQDLEVVLGRVIADPVDEVVVLEAGRALRAPELGHPRERAEEVVDPVDVAAADDHLRVVLEVVEDRDRRVAGEPRRLLADELERAEVDRREVVVRAAGVRAQVHAAERVVADVARDVRAIDDRLDERAHLRLRGRIGAGAELVALRHPVRRPVAVQVEALERRRDLHRDAVPVLDRPLGVDAVELALEIVRPPRDEQPRVVRMRLPRPVRVGDAASSARGRRRRRPRDGARPAAPRAGTAARSSAGSARRRAPRRRRPGSRAGRRRTCACRAPA